MVQTENKFYNHAMQNLIDNTKRRKALESNFDRSRLKEYEDICDTQLSCCVELLKLGAECNLEDGNIILPTDSEVGDVAFLEEEVKERLGDETFYVLFPKKEEPPEEDDDEDELLEDEKDVEVEHNEQSQWGSFNPLAMFLPFFQMIQQPSLSYVKAQQPTKQPLDNPLQAVQDELEHLQNEKKKLKKIAKKYKAEAEELKNQSSGYIEGNSEETKALIENNSALTEQIEKLKLDINESESEKTSLKSKINELKKDAESEKENFKSEIEHLHAKCENAVAEAVKNEADKSRNEIEQLKLEVHKVSKERDEKSSSLSLKINELSKDNQVLKSDYQEISSTLKTCRSERDDAISEKTRLTVEITDLQSKINALKEELKENGNLSAKVTALQSDKQILISETSELKLLISQLERKTASYEKQLIDAKQQIKELEAKAASEPVIIEHYDPVLKTRTLDDFNILLESKCPGKFLGVVSIPLYEYYLDEFDEEVQTKSVIKVAEQLIAKYGASNVYKCGEKQFAVISSKPLSFNDIDKKLSDLALNIVCDFARVRSTLSGTFEYVSKKVATKDTAFYKDFEEQQTYEEEPEESDYDEELEKSEEPEESDYDEEPEQPNDDVDAENTDMDSSSEDDKDIIVEHDNTLFDLANQFMENESD